MCPAPPGTFGDPSRGGDVSDDRPTPDVDDPAPDDEDLTHVEDDSPPPEGAGPAASPEDFEPEDPDPEDAPRSTG
jgi:hypothetical protein